MLSKNKGSSWKASFAYLPWYRSDCLALANIDTRDIKHNISSCEHIITVTGRALSTFTDAHHATNWMSFLPQLLTAVRK